MLKFDNLSKIILLKYLKNKTNFIYDLLNKNKNFKYHSDDYILADTKSIYNKNRTIFIEYIIPSSKLYCVVNCKILLPKKNKNVLKTVITQTKDFSDNVYINLDKDIKNVEISSFLYSKLIKISTKSLKLFIESFNSGLDLAILYLKLQKNNYKVLYYISKVVKKDPLLYIDLFILKIKLSKFKKSILLLSNLNIIDYLKDNYLVIPQSKLLLTVELYYLLYYRRNPLKLLLWKIEVLKDNSDNIELRVDLGAISVLDYDSKLMHFFRLLLFNRGFGSSDNRKDFIICLGDGHIKCVAKYWRWDSIYNYPVFGYISSSRTYLNQGYATRIIYKLFLHHIELFPGKPLLLTEYLDLGKEKLKSKILMIAKLFNVQICMSDLCRYYYELCMYGSHDRLYTYLIPLEIRLKIKAKVLKQKSGKIR